jgi:hypothetical protein
LTNVGFFFFFFFFITGTTAVSWLMDKRERARRKPNQSSCNSNVMPELIFLFLLSNSLRYTMEGDLGDLDGEVPKHAGIIPRVLNNLFNILERDKAEYSVRVSFVELYNEELKDLLSPAEDTRKLRIFEDTTKKGVVLQGVEEVLVKNWADGIRALRRGSHKRQVAATKCNENSR